MPDHETTRGKTHYFVKSQNVMFISCVWVSQVVLVVKNLPANAGDIRDAVSIPGLGRLPWRRTQQPTPVFLPGESHGQRSLVGYSPWGSQAHLVCLKSLEKAINNSFLNHICLSLLGLLYQNTIDWVVSTADICFSQVWMLEVQD